MNSDLDLEANLSNKNPKLSLAKVCYHNKLT
jgi:hypothetical protein